MAKLPATDKRQGSVLAFSAGQFVTQVLNGRGFRRLHADIAIDGRAGFNFQCGGLDLA